MIHMDSSKRMLPVMVLLLLWSVQMLLKLGARCRMLHILGIPSMLGFCLANIQEHLQTETVKCSILKTLLFHK